MAKRTRNSGGGPLSPGVAFTSTDLWYLNSRTTTTSPSPSSSSGSATPTAVAFVGDSTFDFQEDAWEEELARRTPRVLIKWRVNGETTEAFARRVRRAKTTTTLARCDHVIVCTGKNDFAFGVAELIRQNTMAAVLVLRAACGPETHIHVLPPTCILKPGYRATAAEVVRLLRSELQQHGDPRISLLTPRTGYARDAWADSLHLAPEAHAHMLRALLDETVGGEGGGGAGEAAPAARGARGGGGGGGAWEEAAAATLRLRGGVRGRRERGRVRGRVGRAAARPLDGAAHEPADLLRVVTIVRSALIIRFTFPDIGS